MIVRIQRAVIQGIKNVAYGEVSFPCALRDDVFEKVADVTGMYGQNGSGKSAFIFALAALKILLSGKNLPADTADHILFEKQEARIQFTFSVTDEKRFFLTEYEAVIRKAEKKENEDGLKCNGAYISEERIAAKERMDMKYGRQHLVLGCKENEENGKYVISPKGKENRIERAAENGNRKESVFQKARESGCSILFSEEIRKWMVKVEKEQELKEDWDFKILNALYQYGSSALYIIDNRESGFINTNYALPFGINVKEEGQPAMHTVAIQLTESSIFSAKWFHLIEEKIENMNTVLSEIIPGLRVVLKETGKEHGENGAEQIVAELEAERDGRRIPLRYESDGIKKIISVLHMLIAMYNNPSMTLAIDELDSGIFEYLLGEILKVIKESGKGQLFFTSHNLRPLETLDKDCIIFTTANPKNRYIRLKTKKGQNNLRNVYFHDIILGGQKECIYEPTSSYSISRVFRMAGETYAR